MSQPLIEVLEAKGLLDYQQAWLFQEDLLNQTAALKMANRRADLPATQGTHNYLILCQHPHVYTLGKSGKPEHLLASPEKLAEIGATYYPINRGGDVTYHGPGQLVGYPILDLEQFYTDIHRYLRDIEQVIIEVLAQYGITGIRSEGYTGVWIENRKICAIGVRTSRWVTMHGFAFNVNAQLDYFGHIVPCGIADKDVTSLSRELGREVTVEEVLPLVKEAFARVFGATLIPAALHLPGE